MWGLVFSVICPNILLFAVGLANFLMFTVSGENTMKCLQGFFSEKPIGSVKILVTPRFRKSLDLQISSSLGYSKRTNAFLVYAICFHEIVHDKSCGHKSVRQTEKVLERGFGKH